MKNYFSLFTNKRTEYKQMSHLSVQGPREKKTTEHHKSQERNYTSTRYAVPMISTTQVPSRLLQQTYEAPHEKDYEKYRYKQPIYEQSLRPVPSSSYKGSYLNFSGLKINERGTQNKDELSRLGPFSPEYEKKGKDSSLIIERTDYRQLDCFIDKIK